MILLSACVYVVKFGLFIFYSVERKENKMTKDKRKKHSFKGKVSVTYLNNNSVNSMVFKSTKGFTNIQRRGRKSCSIRYFAIRSWEGYHPDRDEEYGIAVPGSLWYKRPYWLHRGVGPENVSIVCPSSIGKKCPICEYRPSN